MTNHTPAQEAALARLELFDGARFRAARWNAIHAARQADLKWDEIADRMGVSHPVVMRFYRNDAPEPDEPDAEEISD